MEKRILTIIVSYNFMPWLHKCIDSVLQSSMQSDILVVDNHSTDDTVATLAKCYPQVKVMANDKNLGFGAANNMGIQYALKENYQDGVILLNQDAWLYPDTITRLVEVAGNHSKAGVMSPVHLAGNGAELENGFKTYVGFNSTDDLPSSPFQVPFVNAAIWYIPLNVITKIGMFSPVFYHYGEDIDFINRLHYHGYQLMVDPKARACHDRQGRKPTAKQFVHSEYVYHLSQLCNIQNPSLAIAVVSNVLQVIKKGFQRLFKGDFKLAGKVFLLVPRLCGKVCEARKHRRLYKKQYIYTS